MGNFRVLRRLFPPVGTARVFLNDEQVATVANSSRYRFDGLESDQHYVYRIEVDGRVSGGSVRTYAAEPDTLTFLVIGDFGTGESAQFDLGEAMAQTIRAKQNTDDPVRFVLTVGDNIYRDKGGPFWWKDLSCEVIKKCRGTGDDDNDWKDKFVLPYKDLLSSVPFYPTLGNHDENQSEERDDLEVYVDNFMLGDRLPSPRYYSFAYGSLAEFFALDTTENAEPGEKRTPMYNRGGDQDRWLRDALTARGESRSY